MGSESIAHEAEKASWAIDSVTIRARGIITLVKFKSIKTRHLSLV